MGDTKLGRWIYDFFDRNKRSIKIVSIVIGVLAGIASIIRLFI